MKRRISLMGSIMTALASLNPFAATEVHSQRKKVRKVESTKHYAKPPTKAKFKQNQRKQRKNSARKKQK